MSKCQRRRLRDRCGAIRRSQKTSLEMKHVLNDLQPTGGGCDGVLNREAPEFVPWTGVVVDEASLHFQLKEKLQGCTQSQASESKAAEAKAWAAQVTVAKYGIAEAERAVLAAQLEAAVRVDTCSSTAQAILSTVHAHPCAANPGHLSDHAGPVDTKLAHQCAWWVCGSGSMCSDTQRAADWRC